MFLVPSNSQRIELTIKRSRFIAKTVHVLDRTCAMQELEHIRKQFPDAGHHCWAYVIGNPRSPKSCAMSDDGEPSGTAGKPILNVLQHRNIGNVLLVVTRYFGGIKLGAGGLVRAYSSSATQVTDALTLKPFVTLAQIEIELEFSQEQFLRHWLSQHDGQMNAVRYLQTAMCTIETPASSLETLEKLAEQHNWKLNEKL